MRVLFGRSSSKVEEEVRIKKYFCLLCVASCKQSNFSIIHIRGIYKLNLSSIEEVELFAVIELLLSPVVVLSIAYNNNMFGSSSSHKPI